MKIYAICVLLLSIAATFGAGLTVSTVNGQATNLLTTGYTNSVDDGGSQVISPEQTLFRAYITNAAGVHLVGKVTYGQTLDRTGFHDVMGYTFWGTDDNFAGYPDPFPLLTISGYGSAVLNGGINIDNGTIQLGDGTGSGVISGTELQGYYGGCITNLDQMYLREEFKQGAGIDGQIGTLGWRFSGLTLSINKATAPPDMGWEFRSSATPDSSGTLYLGTGNETGGGWATLTGTGWTQWRSNWRFKLIQITNSFCEIGLGNSVVTGTNYNSGLYLRYDAGTATFSFVARSGASETVVSSGVAIDTNWHRIMIRSVTPGTILFSLDGGAESSISSNVSGNPYTPMARMGTRDAWLKAIQISFWDFWMGGLTR